MLNTGCGRSFALIASIALALGALAVPFAAIVRIWQVFHTTENLEADGLANYTLTAGLVLLLVTLIANLIARADLRRVLIRRLNQAETYEEPPKSHTSPHNK